jgi:hypothetical protein
MSERVSLVTKVEARKVLRKAGVPGAHIEEVLAELPDPFDLVRDEHIYVRHGLTRGVLIDRMGGSP